MDPLSVARTAVGTVRVQQIMFAYRTILCLACTYCTRDDDIFFHKYSSSDSIRFVFRLVDLIYSRYRALKLILRSHHSIWSILPSDLREKAMAPLHCASHSSLWLLSPSCFVFGLAS